MIYAIRAYYDQNYNYGTWRKGDAVLINADHIVTIAPTYVPSGAVLNTEPGMGMVYDVETLTNNNGYSLKVTGPELDKIFKKALEMGKS